MAGTLMTRVRNTEKSIALSGAAQLRPVIPSPYRRLWLIVTGGSELTLWWIDLSPGVIPEAGPLSLERAQMRRNPPQRAGHCTLGDCGAVHLARYSLQSSPGKSVIAGSALACSSASRSSI